MNRAANKRARGTGKILIPVFLLAAALFLLAGCNAPEGGSSIPWAEPEPWEHQPNFGVPY